MPEAISGYELAQKMIAGGFPLPANCRNAQIVIEPDGPVYMRYDVLLTPEDMTRLGVVLVAVAEEMK